LHKKGQNPFVGVIWGARLGRKKRSSRKREEIKDLAYISALGRSLFGPWRTAAMYYVPTQLAPGRQDKRQGLLDARKVR
jgi:hypothetical protein